MAEEEVATPGPDASMEQLARTARGWLGDRAPTLPHPPRAVEAVSRKRIEAGASAPTTWPVTGTAGARIVLATEHYPDPGAQADRLFRLAVTGLSPQDRSAGWG